MRDHIFSEFATHQIRHQATHEMGCQPGDCIWSLQYSFGVCVRMYELTHFITPEAPPEKCIAYCNSLVVRDKFSQETSCTVSYFLFFSIASY